MTYPETIGGSGPILETVSRILNDDFFSMIEIAHINDVTVRRQVAELVDTPHARVAFGAQPAILSQKLDLNSLDRTRRREAIEKLQPLVDEAREIGAKRFTVLSGPDPEPEKREEARGLLVESLMALCSYAKVRG
jgi:DNA-binding transcriptional regulator YhcF (GntR family)